MSTVRYTYNGKLWCPYPTISDNNNFFHSVFGIRTDEDQLYFDKQAKFRRMRWAAFLTYFENEPMPPCLTDILKKCLSANNKYKNVSTEKNFEKYVSDVMVAEKSVTKEEIIILSTLENVKIVLLSNKVPNPVFIKPNPEILGSYHNVPGKLKEVVLYEEGNMFSRLEPVGEDSNLKSNKHQIQKKTDSNRYKKGGSAGSKGVEYQVNLLALVILNALKNGLTQWKLSTENEEAGKFDDIVLEWSEGAVLIQSKHKEDKKKRVTLEELTSVNSKHDDFSLPKYFLWFQVIKTKFNIQNVIICTNADVHQKALKFLDRHEMDSGSLLHYQDNSCTFFTLNDKMLPDLKEKSIRYYQQNFENKGIDQTVITEENLKDFLRLLQIFFNYPPIKTIEKSIEKLLSHIKCCSNSQGKTTSLEMYSKVMDWFQQKDGVYFTEIHAKAMFAEIWRDKYCQKLEQYNMSFERNDLNFQGTNQIFYVPAKGRCLLELIKIHLSLHDSKANILYVSFDKDIEAQQKVVEAFELPQYVFLIIIWSNAETLTMVKICDNLKDLLERCNYKKIIFVAESDKFLHQIGFNDILHVNVSVTFQDLSSICQESLLKEKKIIFQGKRVSLEELLPEKETEDYEAAISSDVLEKFVRRKEIKVGTPPSDLDLHLRLYYINRAFSRTLDITHVEKRNSEEDEDFLDIQYEIGTHLAQTQGRKGEINERLDEMWSDENREEIFLEDDIFDVKEKLVLISDSAGMGKSTVLVKLALTIKRDHPYVWVFRIVVNDFTRILGDSLENGKTTLSVTELLDSSSETKLTNNLEKFVYSTEQKVVLMFDGIDEISPDYTELILNIIKQCQEDCNFAKIFVTTRPHISKELERVLKVKPFVLKSFTEQNQIDFLTNYWAHNLGLKDDKSKEKCKRYAQQLITNISWTNMSNNTESHFASIPLHVRMAADIFQDSIWDESESNLIKNISVTKLYDLFFNKKWDIFYKKENPGRKTWANQELTKQFNECRVYHRSMALELIVSEDKLRFFSSYKRSDKCVETNLLKIGIVQKFTNDCQFIHRTFADYFVAEILVIELLQNQLLEFQIFLIDTIFLKPQYNITRIFFDSFLQKVVDTMPSNIFEKYQSLNQERTLKFYMLQSKLIHVLAEEGCIAILKLILKCLSVEIIRNNEINISEFYGTDSGVDICKKIAYNTLNVLKYLIQQAGVNIKDDNGRTPLHCAALKGRTDMVKYLVQRGNVENQNDRNIKDNLGYTALHLAACFGQLETVKFLVEFGMDFKTTNSNSRTLLHSASANGHLETVKFLLQLGVDLKIRDDGGNAALHLAACFGQLDTAKFLIEYGFDFNVTNNYSRTLLHSASGNGQLETVKFLLELGIDLKIRDNYGNTALHLAACFGQLDTVKYLVKCGLEINDTNNLGRTILHLSSANGHLETVKFLLELGVDFEIRGKDGNTALHLATYCGQLQIVKFLVEHGLDFSVTANHGRTLLHLASVKGHLETVKFLVELGLFINVKDNDGYTALQLAIYFNQLDTVKFLVNFIDSSAKLFLKYGDYNITNNTGHTLLHSASANGNLTTVKFLLGLGIPFKVRDNDGYTALHLAARFGQLDTVKFLIERGVDCNLPNFTGRTVLHSASAYGHVDTVKFLLELGADCKIVDNEGHTALQLAASCGQMDIVKFFVEYGLDINVTNSNGRTLLHLAAGGGNLQTVEYLLQLGLDFKIKDNYDNTALHLAAGLGQLEAVKLFLGSGLDFNVTGNRGRTLLHLASANGQLETVKFLLQFGMDYTVRDNYGNTVSHLAARFGQLETVKFLVEYGLDVHVSSNNGRTLLHLASENGHLEMVKLLLQLGVDFKIRDNYDNMALHLAAGFGHLDTVKFFAEYGLDLNVKGNYGRTPLHLASANGYLETVKFLLESGANFRIRNNDGLTPVQVAVNSRQVETAKLLKRYIKHSNTINRRNLLLPRQSCAIT